MSFQAAWQALERDEFRTAENIAREALARSPRDGEALYLLGSTLLFEGRYREALAPLSDAAAALEQRGVRYRLGHCHLALGELERAEQVLRAETLAYPASANAHNTLGVVLANQGKREQALAAFQAALALEPRHAEAHHNAGGLLSSLGRAAEALPHLQAVAQARADSAEAHYNLGLLYQSLQRHEDAVVCLERALALAPRMPYALGYLVWSEISLCRWQAAAPHIAALRAGVRADEIAAPPFTLVGASPSPEEQRRCAERHVREQGLGALAPVPRACAQRTPRIRLAYLSADLHEHATAKLAARLFELHDRSAFELIAVSYGPDDGSPMRRRLRAAFDRFEDVRGRDDLDVARWLADAGTSLAVDLKGYTPGARPRILAYRPAPVQASFLGFPGTLGAPFIDYLIADRTVVPAGAETHYSERIVWLPGSYQVNDATREIAEPVPGRAELGLPEEGFIFCCFNNNYKITAEVFALWMRLLKRVASSVLWLLEDNPEARRNLSAAANAHGVDARRLCFAPRLPHERHLARQRRADLFLDTLPCNAHTTASDALWAGLPVLTCSASTFAGRVAASLLAAVGLPELAVPTLDEYEALALRLARERAVLAAYRERLARNRLDHALFDSDRFRRALESAYATMWEMHLRGLPPRAFAVAPQD